MAIGVHLPSCKADDMHEFRGDREYLLQLDNIADGFGDEGRFESFF